jgi:hypothetical protein
MLSTCHGRPDDDVSPPLLKLARPEKLPVSATATRLEELGYPVEGSAKKHTKNLDGSPIMEAIQLCLSGR